MKVTRVPGDTVRFCGHAALFRIRMVRVSGRDVHEMTGSGEVELPLPPHAAITAARTETAPR